MAPKSADEKVHPVSMESLVRPAPDAVDPPRQAAVAEERSSGSSVGRRASASGSTVSVDELYFELKRHTDDPEVDVLVRQLRRRGGAVELRVRRRALVRLLDRRVATAVVA